MVGCATEQAATKIGLEGGTPVIAGTTDAASESISGGGLNNGDIPSVMQRNVFCLSLTNLEFQPFSSYADNNPGPTL